MPLINATDLTLEFSFTDVHENKRTVCVAIDCMVEISKYDIPPKQFAMADSIESREMYGLSIQYMHDYSWYLLKDKAERDEIYNGLCNGLLKAVKGR